MKPTPQTEIPAYPTDTIRSRNGHPIVFSFFKHASLAIDACGKRIYIDPIGSFADYAALPDADLILVTHSHYDHLDPEAIEKIRTPQTVVLCDPTSAETLGGICRPMAPGDTADPFDGPILIEAIAAYNTSDGHTQFHPRERRDCGYLLTADGTRIYIAGDTEPTPEMLALHDLDVVFLPVNQPYTMTVDQAVATIRTLRPARFYPYHYGQTDIETDIGRLAAELQGITEVRIRPME